MLEVGDPMKVEREYEDHWCFGVNLRTGNQGIFPAAHLFPVDPIDEITSNVLPANSKFCGWFECFELENIIFEV